MTETLAAFHRGLGEAGYTPAEINEMLAAGAAT